LGLALSPQRLFHFERAGDDEDGGPLVAIFQRDIVEIG
jgi:hypothetical protein